MPTLTNLKKVCSSDYYVKIIMFFHDNPSIVDTARGLAAWLNMDKQEIQKALAYLAEEKILVSHRNGSTAAYAYTQNKTTVSRINKLLKDKR